MVDWLFLCTCAGYVSSPRPRWVHCCVSVVRWSTHTRPLSGAFICLECQTAVPDVEQQFKFTQVCVTPPQVFLFTSYLALHLTPPLHLSSFSTLVLALFLSLSILPHLPFPPNALSTSPPPFIPSFLPDPLSFSPSPPPPS